MPTTDTNERPLSARYGDHRGNSKNGYLPPLDPHGRYLSLYPRDRAEDQNVSFTRYTNGELAVSFRDSSSRDPMFFNDAQRRQLLAYLADEDITWRVAQS